MASCLSTSALALSFLCCQVYPSCWLACAQLQKCGRVLAQGWLEGVQLLVSLGALVNASNNAGDTPWHWARNMGHAHVMRALEQVHVVLRAVDYVSCNV